MMDEHVKEYVANQVWRSLVFPPDIRTAAREAPVKWHAKEFESLLIEALTR
jgi:hypothetical protein